MREMFEDWFAQSELNQDSNTEKKEALFLAFEAGSKAGDNSSVPAKKLKEEIKHLNSKVTELETALTEANRQIAEYTQPSQEAAAPGPESNG